MLSASAIEGDAVTSLREERAQSRRVATSIGRRYLQPVLKDAGFTRQGKWFRRVNELDDAIVFSFVPTTKVWAHTAFHVWMGISPHAFRAWTRRPELPCPGREAQIADCIISAPLEPPRQYKASQSADLPRQEWAFPMGGDADACGRTLAAEVADTVLPALDALSARSTLFDALVHRERLPYFGDWFDHTGESEPFAAAVLLAAQGPSPELDSALARLFAQYPGAE